MAFILGDQREADVIGAFRRYRQYLDKEGHRFPRGALALATSEWYFDPEDHRCPHDAWLLHLVVQEAGRGERHQHRAVSLSIQLLSAYHDLVLTFTYARVHRYAFEVDEVREGHSDWRYDEFRLNDEGHLTHEIEWRSRSGRRRWLIDADDVVFEWSAAARGA